MTAIIDGGLRAGDGVVESFLMTNDEIFSRITAMAEFALEWLFVGVTALMADTVLAPLIRFPTSIANISPLLAHALVRDDGHHSS